MKKSIVLQVVLGFLFLFGTVSVFASFTVNTAVENQDHIIIVDLAGIGTFGTLNLCPLGEARSYTSSTTFTLPQASPNNMRADALVLDIMKSVPDDFVARMCVWQNCDGNTMFGHLEVFGQYTLTKIMNNGVIVELRIQHQPSGFLVRFYEGINAGTLVVETFGNTQIDQCTSSVENPCYGAPPVDRSEGTGISADIAKPNSLQVQPNPFSSTFQSVLQLEKSSPVSISLLDMTGRELRSMAIEGAAGDNQFTIDSDDLTPGMYLLSVKTESETLVKKVIKN